MFAQFACNLCTVDIHVSCKAEKHIHWSALESNMLRLIFFEFILVSMEVWTLSMHTYCVGLVHVWI